MPELYQYDAYAYPQCVITRGPLEASAKLRTSETPGRAGAYTQGGLLAARRLIASGILNWYEGDGTSEQDAFNAAHAPGLPRLLFWGQDSRYLLAEVESTKEVNPETYVSAREWEVGFICTNPYWYAATATTATLSGSAGGTVTTAGTAPCLPALHFTIGTAATDGRVIVENTTTGETATFDASTTGAVIVNSETQAITLAGGQADALLVSGGFLTLVPGVNVLTLSTTGGAVVTSGSVSVVWQDRWY